MKIVKFNNALFAKHVILFREKLEEEHRNEKIKIPLTAIARGMDVTQTILWNTMNTKNIPRADQLYKMVTYIGHKCEEYFTIENHE